MSKEPQKRPSRLFSRLSLIAIAGTMAYQLIDAVLKVGQEGERRRNEAVEITQKTLAAMEADISLLNIYDKAARVRKLDSGECLIVETVAQTIEFDKKAAQTNRAMLAAFNYVSPSDLVALERREERVYGELSAKARTLNDLCNMRFAPPVQSVRTAPVTDEPRPWYDKAEIPLNLNK